MVKRIFSGTGILSGEYDEEEMEREREQERQKEVAAAGRAADEEQIKHRLEAAIIPYLKNHIAAELRDHQKKKPETNAQDFKRFRAYCARLDLPALPASPQAVAGFLVSELDQGRAHLCRLLELDQLHTSQGRPVRSHK